MGLRRRSDYSRSHWSATIGVAVGGTAGALGAGGACAVSGVGTLATPLCGVGGAASGAWVGGKVGFGLGGVGGGAYGLLTCGSGSSTSAPPPNDPCDKFLSQSLLDKAGIDAHQIKSEIVGRKNWGQFNLCGCRDGRIVLKKSRDCKGDGGEFIGEYWK